LTSRGSKTFVRTHARAAYLTSGPGMGLRLTVQVQLVLRALLRDPAGEMYGLELSGETGSSPDGLSHPRAAGTRRYYRLTAGGAVHGHR
jgi:hypothetical protein